MFSPPLTRGRARGLREKRLNVKLFTGDSPPRKAPRKTLKFSYAPPPPPPAAPAAPAPEPEETVALEPVAGVNEVVEGAELPVLDEEELPRLEDAETALAAAQLSLGLCGSDFAVQHACVDTVRSLAKHHPAVLSESQALHELVAVVLAAVGSLRSAVSRNALRCVRELFLAVPDAMAAEAEEVVATTAFCFCSEKKFIREGAAAALAGGIAGLPLQPMLAALVPQVQHRHFEVAGRSAVQAEACLAAAGVGKVPDAGWSGGEELLAALLPALAAGLAGKVPEGRAASRKALMRVRRAVGGARFAALGEQLLSPADRVSVATATKPKAAKAAGSAGLSLRQRMQEAARAAGR